MGKRFPFSEGQSFCATRRIDVRLREHFANLFTGKIQAKSQCVVQLLAFCAKPRADDAKKARKCFMRAFGHAIRASG